MSEVTVAFKLSADAGDVRLVVDTASDFSVSPVYSPPGATTERLAKLTVTGLAADTAYYCALEVAGVLDLGRVGQFTTPPTGQASFKCAFAGDASDGSNHAVFDAIRAQDPLFFICLGDLHYADIAADDLSQFLAAYDGVMAQAKPSQLLREVPTLYTWDDHDFGPDNSDASSPGRDAACEAYRQRVPHPPLVETGTTDAVYFTHEVGRVLFIVTDQRSMASDKDATDDSSKTILGASQKAWIKGVLSNPDNDGKLFVWVCPRLFGGVPTAGADHWGGFTTERTELADYIKANCPGRVVVLSADMHSLAIDDGSNHDFATGGGEPLPTFQASPLDMTGATTYGAATYSEGGRYTNNGQFGVMEVTDTGGADINVVWKGFDSSGSLLVSHTFDVTLGLP